MVGGADRQTDRQTGRGVWQRKSRAAVVIQKGHILTKVSFLHVQPAISATSQLLREWKETS